MFSCSGLKLTKDVVAYLKGGLDQLAITIHQDPFPLRFPTGSPATEGF
jgi:hypothetical protein